MEEVHREVLRVNLIYLQKNLNAGVADHLFAAKVLEDEHLDQLQAEATESARIKLLVRILRKRGPLAFTQFIKALQDSGQEHVKLKLLEDVDQLGKKKIREAEDKQIVDWLRRRLKPSEVETGLRVADAHRFIVKNCPVKVKERQLTENDTLLFLKCILLSQATASVDKAEEPELLKEILSKSVLEPCETAISEPLVASAMAKISVPDHNNDSTDYGYHLKSSPMVEWSVDTVCHWLSTIGCSKNAIETFRSEEIDGYVLSKLKEDRLKEINIKFSDSVRIASQRDDLLKAVVPPVKNNASVIESEQELEFPSAFMEDMTAHAVLGADASIVVNNHEISRSFLENHQRTIEDENAATASAFLSTDVTDETLESIMYVETDEHNADEASKIIPETDESVINIETDELMTRLPPSETLRKFGIPVDSTFKYKKSVVLTCVESRPGGDLLLPIHRFVKVDMTKKDDVLLFVRESIQFICACLNERANGTIHFGINPQTNSGSISFSGEIVGTKLPRQFKDNEDYLTKACQKCFMDYQIDIVLSCVSLPPVLIEVTPNEGDSLFVVEIDVVAKYSCCEDVAFYARLPTGSDKNYENEALYRIIDGTPRSLAKVEIERFMKIKESLAQNRKEQEERKAVSESVNNVVYSDLQRKFVHLLCDGEESFRGDHYPILVVNAPEEHMTDEWMEENLTFIRDIEWKAVFDFDAEARICKFLQNQEEMIKIIMCDQFSEHSHVSPDHLLQFHEDLRHSVHQSWIFVNGYTLNEDEQPLSPFEWKIQKSSGFKDAVRFFKNEFPPGRATVVFLLFSEDTKVILEAAEEFLMCFPENWMCVAEKDSIGEPWVEELRRRNCMGPKDDRVVFGMPWNHVKDTVGTIQSPKIRSLCQLPSSSGYSVELNPSLKNDLLDLEILSVSECDEEYEKADQQYRDKLKAKAETDFYRGESISWWNFYFSKDQVCKRDIYDELLQTVKYSLQSTCEGCPIETVFIYHQPGAGGTTLARHVLWSLRKVYRVGIVRNITEHETAHQIIKFYQHEDDSPKPVLLLLDNPEEEKANLMLNELDELAKFVKRQDDSDCQPVCVFLICLRRTNVQKKYDIGKGSKGLDRKAISLKHELSSTEREWFGKKAKALQSHFDSKDALCVDPRLLISFNIMKENFDKNFIHRMVKGFVGDISDPDELKLLKYISLINAFDLEQRSVPSAAFDSMMVKTYWQKGSRHGWRAITNRWENKLSDAIRVLMNETSKPALGYIHSLQITNPLLSEKILDVIISMNGEKETVSSIALEFLQNQEIFSAKGIARDELLRIVKDVLKRRSRLPNGLPEFPFSPLIERIKGKESIDRAVNVLEQGFTLSQDPFIAQQIARMFIKAQNWERAIEYAKIATDLKPDCSYLWDTFGRIYEQQLLEEYTRLVDADRDIPVHELIPIIDLGFKGMEMFEKVQTYAIAEKKSLAPNNAGYFGELQMIVCLLDCLSQASCFRDRKDLRQFILDDNYVPGNLSILTDVEGRNFLEELKKLSQKVERATDHIEDELLQLRVDMVIDNKRKHHLYCEDTLVRLKENLNLYFGEETDQPPPEMQEKEQCLYRRRRIFRLAGTNLKSILDLRRKSFGESTLERILDIAIQNVKTQLAGAHDYMTMISVSLALTSMDDSCLQRKDFTFGDIVKWSRRLYELRENMSSARLEPYLFYIMFNWPRKNTKYSVTQRVIEMALKQWKEAYSKKYLRHQDNGTGRQYRTKETTLFFLSNGNDMDSIYTTFDERGIQDNRGVTRFWRRPETVKTLQRFKGRLESGGLEVSVQLCDYQGNKYTIKIPTSLPIRNHRWWNREVYFVIGFSWIGPKAFDVDRQDPTVEADRSIGHPADKSGEHLVIMEFRSRKPRVEIAREQKLNEDLMQVEQNLERIRQLKFRLTSPLYKVSEEEKDILTKEQQYLDTRRSLQMERRELMESRIPDFN